MTTAESFCDLYDDGKIRSISAFMATVSHDSTYFKAWLDVWEQEHFFAVFADGSALYLNPCDYRDYDNAQDGLDELKHFRDFEINHRDADEPIDLTMTHICDVIGKALNLA